MTNQQILEEALQKVRANGWQGTKHTYLGGDWLGDPPKLEVVSPFGTEAWFIYTTGGVDNIKEPVMVEHIIFTHDFAKALWGEDPKFKTTLKFGDKPLAKWQYHQVQMLLAEDPIKYLGEHLGD